MSYYTIIVRFQAKPGKEVAFKEFLASILPVARRSEGCIRHDLHTSLEDPGAFLFYENWVSKEAHARHIERPEVKEWRRHLASYLAKPHEISMWELI